MAELAHSDEELVARSLDGDRDAFGKVVERYQSLVCSLNYSATGSLSQSEDLAQETFITAWKSLRQLHEPNKLRSWLCGMARNLTHNWLRRQGKQPAHSAETIESRQDLPTLELSPPEQAMSKEEAALLWRSLEKIPVTYREPLVLFYREQQSVAAVAECLDLSEDAVRQRLSRGRKLLNERVTSFVEGALSRSVPGRAFTIGVIAALPAFAASASAATLGATAVQGTTAAKAVASAGLLGAIGGPIIGLMGAWFGVKSSLANASSGEERRLILRLTKILGLMVVLSLLFLGGLIGFGKEWFQTQPALAASLLTGFCLAYAGTLIGLILHFNRLQRQTRLREMNRRKLEGIPEEPRLQVKTFEYRSKWSLLGLPLVHVLVGRKAEEKLRPALGWIAVGDFSIGLLFSFGGIAIGGISLGGVSLGALSLGGIAAGLAAGGGLAIGAWAAGGLAVGYLALGGLALAWQAAVGGLAVARHIATGGVTAAQHANDEVARAFVDESPFLQHGMAAMQHSQWLLLLCLLPLGLIMWQSIQAQRQRANTKRPTLWLLAAVGLAGMTGGCGAQSPSTSTLEMRSLTNGVRVVALPFSGSTNVSIFTFVPIGLAADELGQAQWLHLVEHLVIRPTVLTQAVVCVAGAIEPAELFAEAAKQLEPLQSAAEPAEPVEPRSGDLSMTWDPQPYSESAWRPDPFVLAFPACTPGCTHHRAFSARRWPGSLC